MFLKIISDLKKNICTGQKNYIKQSNIQNNNEEPLAFETGSYGTYK